MTEHPVPGGESSVEEVGDDSVIGDVLLALLTNIHTVQLSCVSYIQELYQIKCMFGYFGF